MRSTALLTSALAIGAIAKPLRHQHKRYFLTVDELDVVTVTKYVTPGYGEPAPTPAAAPSSHSKHHHSHSSQPAQQPSSAYVPPPVVVSTPAYTPPAPSPTPSSAAAPVYSTPAAPVYSSPAAPSSSQAAAPSSGSGGAGSYAKYAAVSATSGKDYADSITFMHNVARSNHGHPDLQWDDSLASVAQTVANTCKFKHWAPVSDQGQNLFAASGSFGKIAVDLLAGWYTGEYSNMTGSWDLAQIANPTFEGSGHLTQMVWKGTQKVGCASIDCSSTGGVYEEVSENNFQQKGMTIMHVCQYSPPGNYANEYANNVGEGMANAAGSEKDIPAIVAKIATVAKKSY